MDYLVPVSIGYLLVSKYFRILHSNFKQLLPDLIPLTIEEQLNARWSTHLKASISKKEDGLSSN